MYADLLNSFTGGFSRKLPDVSVTETPTSFSVRCYTTLRNLKFKYTTRCDMICKYTVSKFILPKAKKTKFISQLYDTSTQQNAMPNTFSDVTKGNGRLTRQLHAFAN